MHTHILERHHFVYVWVKCVIAIITAHMCMCTYTPSNTWLSEDNFVEFVLSLPLCETQWSNSGLQQTSSFLPSSTTNSTATVQWFCLQTGQNERLCFGDPTSKRMRIHAIQPYQEWGTVSRSQKWTQGSALGDTCLESLHLGGGGKRTMSSTWTTWQYESPDLQSHSFPEI